MEEGLQVGTSSRQLGKIRFLIAMAILVPQLNLITNAIFLGHHSEESLAVAALTGVYYVVFAGIGFGLNWKERAVLHKLLPAFQNITSDPFLFVLHLRNHYWFLQNILMTTMKRWILFTTSHYRCINTTEFRNGRSSIFIPCHQLYMPCWKILFRIFNIHMCIHRHSRCIMDMLPITR